MSDAQEIHTHGNVEQLARDIASRFGAEVMGISCDGLHPRGQIKIRRGLGFTSIPYGLPDSLDALQALISRACDEPVEEWKGTHTRRG
jgi:hypothetical protein